MCVHVGETYVRKLNNRVVDPLADNKGNAILFLESRTSISSM